MRYFFANMFHKNKLSAFTIVELLVVIALVIVLAGLVLGITGMVQRKGAISRIESEIKALETACESYKADNGVYPQTSNTDALDPNKSFDPTKLDYRSASADLYTELSGTGASGPKSYFPFNSKMLNLTAGPSIIDPFGNNYGYSTAHRYNPTFDLWSTANKQITQVSDQVQWSKNW